MIWWTSLQRALSLTIDYSIDMTKSQKTKSTRPGTKSLCSEMTINQCPWCQMHCLSPHSWECTTIGECAIKSSASRVKTSELPTLWLSQVVAARKERPHRLKWALCPALQLGIELVEAVFHRIDFWSTSPLRIKRTSNSTTTICSAAPTRAHLRKLLTSHHCVARSPKWVAHAVLAPQWVPCAPMMTCLIGVRPTISSKKSSDAHLWDKNRHTGLEEPLWLQVKAHKREEGSRWMCKIAYLAESHWLSQTLSISFMSLKACVNFLNKI